jgi:hypothetical protein
MGIPKTPFAPRNGRPDGPRRTDIKERIQLNEYAGERGYMACCSFWDKDYKMTQNELSAFLRGTRFLNLHGEHIMAEYCGTKPWILFPEEK